jgi:hypothetical protein
MEEIARNQILHKEKIKGRQNSRNACYRAVQKHFSSYVLSKSVNIYLVQEIISLVSMVCKHVFNVNGRTQTDVVWEQGARKIQVSLNVVKKFIYEKLFLYRGCYVTIQ